MDFRPIVFATISAFSSLTACASPGSPPPSTAVSTKSALPSAAPLKAPGEATVGDRTTCPTSGEEFTVTADSPKVEYNGKTYYFCCGGCDTRFARDPERYLKKKPDA